MPTDMLYPHGSTFLIRLLVCTLFCVSCFDSLYMPIHTFIVSGLFTLSCRWFWIFTFDLLYPSQMKWNG